MECTQNLALIDEMIQANFVVWTEKLRQKMEILENLWTQDNAGVDLDTFLDNYRSNFDVLKDNDDMIEAPITGFDIPVIDPRCPPEVRNMAEVG